jgi:hypothetical protein
MSSSASHVSGTAPITGHIWLFETRQIRKAREAFGVLRLVVALHSSAISSGHEGFSKERKAATSPRTPYASPYPIYAQVSVISESNTPDSAPGW